jgi:uncharacterized membrane protein
MPFPEGDPADGNARKPGHLGLPGLGLDVSIIDAVIMEVLMMFFLVMVIFGTVQVRQDAERVTASFSNESEARQDAERVAAGFSNESEKALAIQTAAAAYGGALPADGTRECPSAYPIKGNATSLLYHEPGTPTYMATIAEYCFASAEGARAAGFTSTAF